MKPVKDMALLCLAAFALCGCEMFETKSAAKAPEKPVPHFEKALACERQGAWEEAAIEYRLAVREKPDDSRAWVNLGRIYSRAAQYSAAEACWLKAVEVNPREARGYNLLGAACMRERNYNKALEWYQKALEIDPNDAAVHWNTAIAYRSLNMDRDAARHYRKYLDLAPAGEAADAAEARRFLEARADE